MNDLDWGGPIGLSYATDHPDNVARLLIRRRSFFATQVWDISALGSPKTA